MLGVKWAINGNHCVYLGYDQIPIELGSSTYSAIDAMDEDVTVGDADLNFDQIPTPPQTNNQVAAWYDTDL